MIRCRAAQVTITVSAPGNANQAPAAPSITSIFAKSATEVDLTWTPGANNGEIAGYQIIRNGSALTSVPGYVVAWADTGVTANTSYSYTLRTYDAAGNYSVPGNIAQVTTPAAAAAPSGCPAPAAGAFTGCYYANTGLSGDPALALTDNQINFDWWSGPPDPSLPAAFSIRWQGNFTFDQGTYTFTAVASDGIRIYIDGNVGLDRWRDQPAYMYIFNEEMNAGNHLITVEYYSETGWPTAHLSWQRNP